MTALVMPTPEDPWMAFGVRENFFSVSDISNISFGESEESRFVARIIINTITHFNYPSIRRELAIGKRFYELAEAWREEARLVSSLSKIMGSPAYRDIIAMGTHILPYLIYELEHEPKYWFGALREITKEDPVPPEARGNIDAMIHFWLTWAEHRGLR